MLLAINLMVGASQARRRAREAEGAIPVERTTMQIKDQVRKVPEPVVVLAQVNGHQIRALLDTGSMADFLSTTLIDQLDLQTAFGSISRPRFVIQDQLWSEGQLLISKH